MTTVKALLKKHPLSAYFALMFAITWGCMALVIGPGGFPISAEQLAAAGPLVYLAMLAGPSGACLILTGLIDGRAGYHELLSRLRAWRVGARWYAVALLAAPLLATTILLVLALFSPAFLPAMLSAEDKPALLLSAIAAGLIVGLCEELGWTGFAVPQMRLRHGVFATGVSLGLLWGAWHFLLFWKHDSFAGALPLALLLAQLFAWLPPYRILMLWVYAHTQSLLVVALMHASLVASTLALPSMDLAGMHLLTWLLAWAAALWIAAAVAVARARRILVAETVAS